MQEIFLKVKKHQEGGGIREKEKQLIRGMLLKGDLCGQLRHRSAGDSGRQGGIHPASKGRGRQGTYHGSLSPWLKAAGFGGREL